MDNEKIMQLQMIEQEANQLSSQSEMIEQHLSEVQELKSSLTELEKDETQEILVNLGKKIYLPVEIKKKELIVEVGNKTFVKKTISETKQLVDEQLEKLVIAKDSITRRLQELDSEMDIMIKAANPESGCTDCQCEHDEDHECSHEHCKCKHD